MMMSIMHLLECNDAFGFEFRVGGGTGFLPCISYLCGAKGILCDNDNYIIGYKFNHFCL